MQQRLFSSGDSNNDQINYASIKACPSQKRPELSPIRQKYDLESESVHLLVPMEPPCDADRQRGCTCHIQECLFYCCEALLMLVISALALLYIFVFAPSFSAKMDASSASKQLAKEQNVVSEGFFGHVTHCARAVCCCSAPLACSCSKLKDTALAR